jgi:hypothetical protein
VRRFKVRDLLIQLPPKGEAEIAKPFCGLGFSLCRYPTLCAGTTICRFPTLDPCGGGVTLCLYPTIHGCNLPTICRFPTIDPCGFISPYCGGISRCGPSEFAVGEELVDPVAGLQTLREQLQGALSEIERQEAEVAEGMQPQSVEELDELEGQLNQALEELKARRAELTKGTGKRAE